MKHLLEYNKWTTTTSQPGLTVSTTPAEVSRETGTTPDVQYHYKSGQNLFYGIHEIWVTWEGSTLPIKAKFDTGARTSSLDINAARRLGVDERIIQATKDLEEMKIPKTIPIRDQKEMEEALSLEYSQKYPGVSYVQMSKSASGFSVRLYLEMTLNFNGRIISTNVNLKDRTGMNAQMLVGLGDML